MSQGYTAMRSLSCFICISHELYSDTGLKSSGRSPWGLRNSGGIKRGGVRINCSDNKNNS